MALQIPSLGNDRSTHPDWAGTAAPGRQPVAAAQLADALESLPAAAGVDAGLIEALRRVGARGGAVELFFSTDRGAVQVLVDGRRIALGTAARDAVLALLRGTAAAPGPALSNAPVPAGADAAALAHAASIDAQVRASRTHPEAPPATPRDAPQLAAAWTRPLMSGADAHGLPAALAAAVESSGLFVEAHLAQWLRGERTLAQVQAEQPAGPAADADQRAATQLDALQRQAVALTGEAWPGQQLRWEIERDRERHREAANLGDATGLFQATLRLDLHRLGGLRARIRVMEGTVGVQIQAEHPAAFASDLQRLADALGARGLEVATLALDPLRAQEA